MCACSVCDIIKLTITVQTETWCARNQLLRIMAMFQHMMWCMLMVICFSGCVFGAVDINDQGSILVNGETWLKRVSVNSLSLETHNLHGYPIVCTN